MSIDLDSLNNDGVESNSQVEANSGPIIEVDEANSCESNSQNDGNENEGNDNKRVWAYNGEEHQVESYYDDAGQLHKIHRWIDREGKRHYTDCWVDQNGNEIEVDKWEDGDGCTHELHQLTTPNG